MTCPFRTTSAARYAVFASLLMTFSQSGAARAEEAALTGTWAIERVVRSSYTLPLVGLVINTQTTRALWRFEREGTTTWVRERLCAFRTKTSEPGLGATMRPGFTKGASGRYLTAKLTRDTSAANFMATGGHVVGAELGPGAALPTSPTDPAVRDLDNDGQPGFTVVLKGAIAGEIQFVRRERLTYKGTLSANEVAGTVGLEIEQVSISATNPLLLIPLPETIEAAHFHGHRVADGATCKTVLTLTDL